MGVTYVEGVLTGPTGKHATVRFWVDSGATYTLVPHDVSKTLDLAPKRTVAFTLADGIRLSAPSPSVILRFPKARGIRPSYWEKLGTKRSWEW